MAVEDDRPVPGTLPIDETLMNLPGPAGNPVPTAAAVRFQTCRWRRPSEAGSPECCVHRDVLPMAGTRGFSPDSWCPECAYFKLRRTPKKRTTPDEEPYYYY